jgi:hypothetical protein
MANRRGKYDEAEKAAFSGVQSQSRDEFFTDQLRKKFMTLPLAQKELIREAKKEGIEWRGEDIQRPIEALGGRVHFQVVIDEFREMRRIGISEYRKKALARRDAYQRRNVGTSGGQRA